MSKEKWKLHSDVIDGKILYRIGRRIDRTQPLNSGNVEYYGDRSDDFDLIFKVCEILNREMT